MARICEMLKYPRTQQERKANQDWPVRGKRTPRQLPTAWDDNWRSNLGDRCWKRHRKTQYKGVTRGNCARHAEELPISLVSNSPKVGSQDTEDEDN